MTSIEEEIIQWATGRPIWLQNVIAQVVRHGNVDQEFLNGTADSLINETLELTSRPLQANDLPTGGSPGSIVQLVSIGNLSNVNALLGGQRLSFGPSGLTLVYGDNGSGKSGYARLIKEIVGARHKEKVLPNAFDLSADGLPQAAGIEYSVDGVNKSATWPQLSSEIDLRSIHFYDEACGDDYIATDTDVSYRPSVLTIFDDIILAADALRKVLDERLQAVSTPLTLPQVNQETAAADFLQHLSARTTLEDIETACKVEDDAQDALGRLAQEEARLQATNPVRERSRLKAAASSIAITAEHFKTLGTKLGHQRALDLIKDQEAARSLRKAADLASSANFSDEPLAGVGSESWRALWAAAETFAASGPYSTSEFPPTHDTDRCPLCQQLTTEDARDRLARFHRFVHDETGKRASEAESRVRLGVSEAVSITISTASTTDALLALQAEDQQLADTMRKGLELAELVKNRLVARLNDETDAEPLELLEVDTDELLALAKNLDDRADKIDETKFKKQVFDIHTRKQSLAAQVELANAKQTIIREVSRLAEASKIKKARDSVSTGTITQKSTALTRSYVTSRVSDRFIRESARLRLEKVALADRGGTKGILRHKPSLLGAGASKSPKVVLSEGEQTALGLAGLFTETAFDESKSTVVLDDPVSSLSHSRRNEVAKRIVELAADRQVIVFTHDLTFLGYLAKFAIGNGVAITERCVDRTGGNVPGLISNEHPWKSKDASKRFHDLEQTLAEIRRERDAWTQEEYLRRVGEWAGDLSQTYERIVRSNIINQVVDRATTIVSPLKFRMLAKITEEDNRDFQEGYGEVSEWARRHDKSEDTNFVAPTVERMAAELERATAWFKRIKSYQS